MNKYDIFSANEKKCAIMFINRTTTKKFGIIIARALLKVNNN